MNCILGENRYCSIKDRAELYVFSYTQANTVKKNVIHLIFLEAFKQIR